MQPITTGNITSTSSPRTSSSIPLQSLEYRFQPTPVQSVRARESASEKGSRRSSLSAESVESEYSLWTDTGDLAEQLANEEDPLRVRLGEPLDREISSPSGSRARVKQLKRVHYPNESNLVTEQAEPEKTSIEIPRPPPRHISRVERLLAVIMSPSNRQTAQMHGLVGKPLLYVNFIFLHPFLVSVFSLTPQRYFTSVFVSLGVFLFGYDQGVMSGIITFVSCPKRRFQEVLKLITRQWLVF